jgi:hypothetical protein
MHACTAGCTGKLFSRRIGLKNSMSEIFVSQNYFLPLALVGNFVFVYFVAHMWAANVFMCAVDTTFSQFLFLKVSAFVVVLLHYCKWHTIVVEYALWLYSLKSRRPYNCHTTATTHLKMKFLSKKVLKIYNICF